MKKFAIVVLTLLMLIAVVGCSSSDDVEYLAYGDGDMAGMEKVYESYEDSAGEGLAGSSSWAADEAELQNASASRLESRDAPQLATDRKLILSADATLETKEFDKSRAGIETALTAAGGYTQDSELRGDGSDYNLRRYSAVLRVPQDKFEDFVEGVKSYGNVLSLSKSGDDVTDRYFDNEARVRILEAEETELLDLMGKADKVSDVFSIRERISEIRFEIEGLKGENIKTDNLVAMSTVSIQLIEVESISPATEEGFFAKAGYTFSSSIDAFVSFVQGFALALIAIAPFALLVLVIVAVVVILIRRYNKKKQANLSTDE